jgi:hypothetical protein
VVAGQLRACRSAGHAVGATWYAGTAVASDHAAYGLAGYSVKRRAPESRQEHGTPLADRESILRTIETWPVEDRVAFAQAILRGVAEHRARPQRPAWREIAGLASAGQTPTADEKGSRWLDEYRSEKYG